jgi:hypothetical protein
MMSMFARGEVEMKREEGEGNEIGKRDEIER